MISEKSGFKFIDRGFEKSLLLIPGWATDFRIFSRVDLRFNYILPLEFNAIDISALPPKISCLGWSIGGFIAKDLALKYPYRFEELILVGVREKYPQEELQGVASMLEKNQKGFLSVFYTDCFTEKDGGWPWFKENLLKDYLENIKYETLLAGLDYLSKSSFNKSQLASLKNVRLVHGTEDKIAPFDEISRLASGVVGVRLIPLEGLGHIPFLNKEFENIISNG